MQEKLSSIVEPPPQVHFLPRTIHRLLLLSALLSTVSLILSLTLGGFGSDSMWTVPSAWLFTAAHHVTLYILSRRRAGPPPLPSREDETTSPIKNYSRSSVYHPASKQDSTTAFGTNASASAASARPSTSDEPWNEPYPGNASSHVNIDRDATTARISTSTGTSTGTTNAVARFSRDRYTVTGLSGATATTSPKYPSFTLTTANLAATGALGVLWTAGAVIPLALMRRHVVVEGNASAVGYFFRNMVPIPEAVVVWTLFGLLIRARKGREREGQFMRMENC